MFEPIVVIALIVFGVVMIFSSVKSVPQGYGWTVER